MLKSLKLKNYRNLSSDFDLQRINLIIAPNGSGKSNLLEAVYLATMGKSFRPVQNLQEYLPAQAEFSKVSLLNSTDDLLEMILSNQAKAQRKYIWNNKQKGISKLIGNIPVILFAPHSVNLVNEDPAGRRADLDDFLSLISSSYASSVARYKKVLRNRNALLKHIRDSNGNSTELQYWTSELVKLGAEIHRARIVFFEQITDFIEQAAAQIYRHKQPQFSVQFNPNSFDLTGDYAASLTQKFAENAQKEVVVGQTLYGSHKDDYVLGLNGQDLRYLGSRGEQRLAVLVWKLAQHDYLYRLQNKNALLLIDDIMSELDVEHRQRVAEVIVSDSRYQAIVTSADEGDVPELLLKEAQKLKLS